MSSVSSRAGKFDGTLLEGLGFSDYGDSSDEETATEPTPPVFVPLPTSLDYREAYLTKTTFYDGQFRQHTFPTRLNDTSSNREGVVTKIIAKALTKGPLTFNYFNLGHNQCWSFALSSLPPSDNPDAPLEHYIQILSEYHSELPDDWDLSSNSIYLINCNDPDGIEKDRLEDLKSRVSEMMLPMIGKQPPISAKVIEQEVNHADPWSVPPTYIKRTIEMKADLEPDSSPVSRVHVVHIPPPLLRSAT